MSRTINGKNISKIMEELQADFPSDAIQTRSYDGIPYMSVDVLRKRLDDVVGIGHYNEIYSEAKIVQVRDTYATNVKCRLEFLDDDFNICLVKEANGGSNIAFPKDKSTDEELTKTQSVPNDLYAAGTDAFKKICKNLLHIGEKQIEIAKNGVTYTVKINSLKPYGANVFGFGMIRNDAGAEEQYNIAIFKSELDAFKKAYGANVEALKGKVIKFQAKEGTDKNGNPQLIFKKAVKDDSKANNSNSTTNSTKPSQSESPSGQQNMTQNNTSNNTTAQNSQQSKTSIKVTTLGAVQMQGNVYYCLVKDEHGKKYNLCFAKENLPAKEKWENFQKKAADGIQAIVDCTINGNRIEFLGFTKKAA